MGNIFTINLLCEPVSAQRIGYILTHLQTWYVLHLNQDILIWGYTAVFVLASHVTLDICAGKRGSHVNELS